MTVVPDTREVCGEALGDTLGDVSLSGVSAVLITLSSLLGIVTKNPLCAPSTAVSEGAPFKPNKSLSEPAGDQ